MRIVTFEDYGPPEVLHSAEAPDPEPGPLEVRVRIGAAGVCRHDVLHRAGKLPGSPAKAVLGHEIAGTIDAVGDFVEGVSVGDRVIVYHKMVCGRCEGCLAGRSDLCRVQKRLGTHHSGGYAELICVPQQNVIPVPDGVSLVDAALAVCPIGTSLRGLRAGGAALGKTVVVVGAAGGLGVHEIQLAAAAGLRVVAITRSEAGGDELRGLGADDHIVSPDGDFVGQVKDATDGEGADLVLDNVVSGTLNSSLRVLKHGGSVVVMGNMEVVDIPIRPGLLIYKRLHVMGSGTPTRSDVRDVLTTLRNGAVRPVVSDTLPLAEAGVAHARLERGGVLGRIALIP